MHTLLPIAVIRGENNLHNESVQPHNYQCPWRVVFMAVLKKIL